MLRLEEVESPVPADDEILVRTHATTVNRTDCHRRGADPFLWRLLLGVRRPRKRVLGMEFAGVVEAVGSEAEVDRGKRWQFRRSAIHRTD